MTQKTDRILLKWQKQHRCQITASHVRTFEDVNVLADIAKSDFPGLKDDQIEVKLYLGSIGHPSSLGIEFDVDEAHSDYRQSEHLLGGL
jgi:hypothetical protein